MTRAFDGGSASARCFECEASGDVFVNGIARVGGTGIVAWIREYGDTFESEGWISADRHVTRDRIHDVRTIVEDDRVER